MKALRWKGLLPFVLISILIYVVTVFFMDVYLRRLLVKQGTRLNGALVEVDRLSLSFLQSRLTVRGLRAADPSELMKNRLELDKVVADFRFLPLLKKKFVIEEIAVEGVKWGTARKKAGAVPAAWQKEWAESAQHPSLLQSELAQWGQEVHAALPQLDLKQLGERFDPRQLVKVEELEAYRRATALPGEVQKIGEQWKNRGPALLAEKKQKIADLRRQVEALDPRRFKDPAAAIQAIQTVQNLKTEIEAQRQQLRDLRGEVQGSLNQGAALVQQARQGLDQDIANLKKKIGFADFQLDRLSETLFGLPTVQRYARYLEYYRQANRYLAKVQSGKKREPEPRRARGRTVRFPITDRTPSFLLAKLNLSADTRNNREVGNNYRGLYSALATSISSEPKWLPTPAEVELAAQMSGGAFQSAKLKATLDRRSEENRDTFGASVHGLRLAGMTLGGGGIFPIPLQNGVSDWNLTVALREETIQAEFSGDFQNLTYQFAAYPSANDVVKILREVLQTIDRFRLSISLAGPLHHPALRIQSTFDEALKNGLQKVAMQKVNEAQTKLEAYLRREIEGKIAAGQTLLAEKEKEILSAVESQWSQVNDLSTFADRRLRELKDQQLGSLKNKIPSDQVRDQAKDLRRRFGF